MLLEVIVGVDKNRMFRAVLRMKLEEFRDGERSIKAGVLESLAIRPLDGLDIGVVETECTRQRHGELSL